ncbi:MAG TPA: Zn-ribbon domain-containing OB-fold protein [Candidatus Lokiarchaeia archaeon]|nr:Zn-ribbon domain-containing OB-fold protein [Candidatus Lokiarchaeia archaeon]
MVEQRITKTQGFVRAEYAFWVGKYMEFFYQNYEKKKIVGNKCPKCGKVFVPPRKICGNCSATIDLDSWVELGDTGTLINFTTTPYLVAETRIRTKNPYVIGMVKIDGSDTAVVYEILETEEKNLQKGMKVQAVWKDKASGNPADIKGFKPI